MQHPSRSPAHPSRRASMAMSMVLLAAGALPQAALAQPGALPRETLVKAAFLHKFSSFVDWPAGTFARPDTPLKIGVLGDDQLWHDLRELARDRDRDGRPVQVTRLAPGEPLAGHHILYLKATSPARISDMLATVPEGVLTVADSDGAHPRGSVISFFLEDGRVRFGASVDAAVRQRLRLSSRLLSVARSVQGAAEADLRFAFLRRPARS
jgi:hypothetical protein